MAIIASRFPTHAVLKEKWKKIVGVDVVTTSSGVCSSHFSNDDIAIYTKRTSLKTGAVPSQKVGICL